MDLPAHPRGYMYGWGSLPLFAILKNAASIITAMIDVANRTFTTYNVKEFAQHQRVAVRIDASVYFAHPNTPRLRWING